ncbi:hypothetical protein M758_UG267100 [Ceratodon purpureus]|nr:hypothetical protein M758_UG267100 [Ceratodon purpureus]
MNAPGTNILEGRRSDIDPVDTKQSHIRTPMALLRCTLNGYTIGINPIRVDTVLLPTSLPLVLQSYIKTILPPWQWRSIRLLYLPYSPGLPPPRLPPLRMPPGSARPAQLRLQLLYLTAKVVPP